MHCVCLIEGLSEHHQHYMGVTGDLKQRLGEHNAGKSSHTAKFKPWRLVAYLAFAEQAKAEAFERYLKIRVRSRICSKAAMVAQA